ncbi:LOB domain-containing protein 40-like [Diospyros lotus]|uniref:LOB domain-containing protein 40-like n=1 Tax=Diospyros lotus TaxID=55363 RepID=UPI00225AEDE9|nr:LOB domain-containing protein 40-like [Diospyros lotus]
MRMSCNGCRVLRKGCSENCTIRPCLQWIRSPESQANATVFLAKFYGRAGLLNLINAGTEHLRPAIFRSLLYEACGRIVNPTYGSVGLLWSGSWSLCQTAVEAVLRGDPITQVSGSEAEECNREPPLKSCDIRHLHKEEKSGGLNDLHRVRTRCRFKKSGGKAKSKAAPAPRVCADDEMNRSTSHESTLSQQSEVAVAAGDSREAESLGSADTAEASLMIGTEAASAPEQVGQIELELTLGSQPVPRPRHVAEVSVSVPRITFDWTL